MTRRKHSNPTLRSKSLLRRCLIPAAIVASCLPLASHAGSTDGEVIVQLRSAEADIAPLLVKH